MTRPHSLARFLLSHRLGRLAAGFTLATTLGCAGEEPFSLDDDDLAGDEMPRLADGETRVNGALVATIALDGGGSLRFVELEPGHIGVLEETPAGARSISAVADLPVNAPVAEVFHAFAEPGRQIPDAILAVSGSASPSRAQGWARDVLARAPRISTGICNDTSFTNYFTPFQYNDHGTPDIRLNKVPDSSGYFEPYDNSYGFYHYVVGGDSGSRWYNIDRYVTRVAVCELDSYRAGNPQNAAHPHVTIGTWDNQHLGPVVTISYRTPGNSAWTVANTKDFAPSELGTTLGWHFYTGMNWDWRTQISETAADDSFDIGHAVETL